LDKNQIKKIPVDYSKLTNLIVFDLDDNMLRTIPQEFINLVNLKELYLGGNFWVSFPENLNEMIAKLEYGQSQIVKKLILKL